jgi:hypothetical protein
MHMYKLARVGFGFPRGFPHFDAFWHLCYVNVFVLQNLRIEEIIAEKAALVKELVCMFPLCDRHRSLGVFISDVHLQYEPRLDATLIMMHSCSLCVCVLLGLLQSNSNTHNVDLDAGIIALVRHARV